MTTSPKSALPPLPDAPVDDALSPRVGQYEGAFDEVRWGYPKGWLKGQLDRALTRKRWFQVLVSDGNLQLVAAIVDQGYGGYGWVWLVDAGSGETLAHHGGLGAPLTTLVVGSKAGEGADASMRLPWAQLRLRRGRGKSAFHLTGRWPGFELDLTLDTAGEPPPFTAIGTSPAGGPGMTQRHGLLEADGFVVAKGTRQPFDGALASLEYTNAFFEHVAAWQSAIGLGYDVGGDSLGFSLSDAPHVGGAPDAAAWIGGALRGVSLPEFTVGADPGADRWTIRTAEGTELVFTPRGHRVDAVNAGPVKTRVVRAVGFFDGTLTSAAGVQAEVESIHGLCEARDLKW